MFSLSVCVYWPRFSDLWNNLVFCFSQQQQQQASLLFCVCAERKVTQFNLTFSQQINFPHNRWIWSNEWCFDLYFPRWAKPIIIFTRVPLFVHVCVFACRFSFQISTNFLRFLHFYSSSCVVISLDKLFEICAVWWNHMNEYVCECVHCDPYLKPKQYCLCRL